MRIRITRLYYFVSDNKLNLGPTAVSTNIDDYLGELEACYREGYHLNTHLRVPGECMWGV